MPALRQYESRLDRKLDETGDLTVAQENVIADYKVTALYQAKSLRGLNDLIATRARETNEERIRRLRAALSVDV